jgi:hypothetical protein
LQFAETLEKTIRRDFTSQGLVNKTPIASTISIDKSTSKIVGKAANTLNLYLLDKMSFKQLKYNLGVFAFECPEDLDVNADEEAVHNRAHPKALEVAKWIIVKLQYWNLVPSHMDTYDISQYVLAAATDNGPVEMCAVKKILNLLPSNCASHCLDLAFKEAVKESYVRHLDEKLGDLSHRMKQGDATLGFFLKRQRDDGVKEPRNLVSRNATRWINVLGEFTAALNTRDHLNETIESHMRPDSHGRGGVASGFSHEDFTVMLQTGVHMHNAKVLTSKLQSRELVIGEDLPLHLETVDTLRNPSSLLYPPNAVALQ